MSIIRVDIQYAGYQMGFAVHRDWGLRFKKPYPYDPRSSWTWHFLCFWGYFRKYGVYKDRDIAFWKGVFFPIRFFGIFTKCLGNLAAGFIESQKLR